ncbi:putative NAD dependent epimerase/dehydratase [Mollisia scopiformis]|uniref:Putative NAD dependent epimerase/dehydratase n=1 Tax=Mollisia scopiformis TaxID=149040 RepID=A0A194XI52_MOLSC|nr:putative NAD dependent epimerase/dehydratase [Mollisia scopiformis]KUJ19442.1 putative NAD dependent epimerase/dehydratase [Mollisia scopiformis]
MTLPTTKNQIVLISGVNGYIASVTAKAFLEAGYSVRGTSRSKSSSEGLLKALPQYAEAGRLQIVEVKDITIDGAFDEAVKGVHAIAHMASPVSFHFTDPDPIIKAALHGTNSILASALKHGSPTLQHVVITSSIAAIISTKEPPYVYTEKDWNDESEAEIARLGKQTPGSHIYRGSKAVAEKAFWKFRDENQPGFTMTSINPAFVYGPPAVLPEGPEKIAETVKPVYDILAGKPLPPPMGGSGAFVDVRDVAALMVLAVEKGKEMNGERYIAAAGIGGMQQIADILNEGYPQRKGKIAVGEPGKGYEPGFGFPKEGSRIDSAKGKGILGREWIGYKECVLDAAKEFERYL